MKKGDTDDDGWEYSFSFFGKDGKWVGTPSISHYVRRRRWIRMRKRIDNPAPETTNPTLERQSLTTSLLSQLELCRLDREKYNLLLQHLKSSSDTQKVILNKSSMYTNLFEQEKSKVMAIQLILEYLHEIKDGEMIRSTLISSLRFHSDRKKFITK